MEGYLDGFSYSWDKRWLLRGWAMDRRTIMRRPEVTVTAGGARVGSAIANLRRDDLLEAGIGDGCYGFEIAVGEDFLRQSDLTYTLHAADEDLGAFANLAFERIIGRIDAIQGIVASGWILDTLNKDQPVLLDLILDGLTVDRVVADRYREDLAAVGGGRCGFVWLIPEAYWDCQQHILTARVSNRAMMLDDAGIPVTIDADSLPPEVRRQQLLLRNARQSVLALEEALASQGRLLGEQRFKQAMSDLQPLEI